MLKGLLPIASKNPVKRTSGAFAVKERARCRKKLVVAACRHRPSRQGPNNLTPDGIDDAWAHAVHPPTLNLTGHPSVALPSASIAQFADTSLSIGWVGGPSRGPREEEEWTWPTIREGER